MIVNPDADVDGVDTKTFRKILRKRKKTTNYWKPKDSETEAKWTPSFYI